MVKLAAESDPSEGPRWRRWTSLPHVALWEALALSVGKEPTEKFRDWLERHSNPRERGLSALARDLLERRKDCGRAISWDGPIRPQGHLYAGMTESVRCKVLLHEVADYLLKIGYDVPEGMLSEGQVTDKMQSSGHGDAEAPGPLSRWAAQEVAILDMLRKLGFEPTKLPVNEPGRPGVKAQTREALGTRGIWTGETVFEKAWDRLRQRGDIADRR